ncbi:hypothetical protein HYZ99_01170, partial [Candidatus Peregrinibacteria bacterium]|nr:hypothetical protein [Candidatus Peregrinibacteria bacterium]
MPPDGSSIERRATRISVDPELDRWVDDVENRLEAGLRETRQLIAERVIRPFLQLHPRRHRNFVIKHARDRIDQLLHMELPAFQAYFSETVALHEKSTGRENSREQIPFPVLQTPSSFPSRQAAEIGTRSYARLLGEIGTFARQWLTAAFQKNTRTESP